MGSRGLKRGIARLGLCKGIIHGIMLVTGQLACKRRQLKEVSSTRGTQLEAGSHSYAGHTSFKVQNEVVSSKVHRSTCTPLLQAFLQLKPKRRLSLTWAGLGGAEGT